MASRNSFPNPVYYHSEVGAEWQIVQQSVFYCSELALAARVKFACGGGSIPLLSEVDSGTNSQSLRWLLLTGCY
jgi:hypothetical protein